MSLVVGQTLPYSSSQLQLEDPERWIRLLPLMRPSMKPVETKTGQKIIINTALAKSGDVLIVSFGELSSKVLHNSHVAAFASQEVTIEEVSRILDKNVPSAENKIVIVQRGPGIQEVLKSSFDATTSLLELFEKSSSSTTSTFLPQKSGSKPSVTCADGLAQLNSAKAAVHQDLDHLLGRNPSLESDVVYTVHFSDINGLSRLESNILAHDISAYFAQKKLPLYLTNSSISEISLETRGWAISLSVVPSIYLKPQASPSTTLRSSIGQATLPTTRSKSSNLTFPELEVRKIITEGCNSVIAAEPTITEYDTIVGDGDCGYTLRDGAKQVLSIIRDADLSKLPTALSSLVDELEVNMGGTSGALYCIFLSSLSQQLVVATTFAEALESALEDLLKYTNARLGDRTCLDCLIPFVKELRESGNREKALTQAEAGVERTKKMEAKLGRSSYLDESATRGVPDPGAYGLLMLLRGMVGGNNS